MEEGNQQEQEQQIQYAQGSAPDLAPISWTASEYIAHQKTTNWYIALGSGSAVITLLVFLITRNLLSGFVIALACVSIGIFAARQPETKQYTLDDRGITTGDKFFPYSIFKSYSVMDDGALHCIWLRPLKRFMPTVAMYFAPDDEDTILDMLDNFLPQEDREHDMVERIARRVRF